MHQPSVGALRIVLPAPRRGEHFGWEQRSFERILDAQPRGHFALLKGPKEIRLPGGDGARGGQRRNERARQREPGDGFGPAPTLIAASCWA